MMTLTGGGGGRKPVPKSDFYGTWTSGSITTVINETSIVVTTSGTPVNYTIASWNEISNTNSVTKTKYPYGYKIVTTSGTSFIYFLNEDKGSFAASASDNLEVNSMTVYSKNTGTTEPPNTDDNYGKLTVQNLSGSNYAYVYNNQTITTYSDWSNKGSYLVANMANNSDLNNGNTIFTLEIIDASTTPATTRRFKETGTFIVAIIAGTTQFFTTDVNFVNGNATVNYSTMRNVSELPYR
jgi:hypothetical protein